VVRTRRRANMEVRNGEVVDAGELLGQDIRTQRGFPHIPLIGMEALALSLLNGVYE
jgi:hypothetical protein